MVDDFIVITIVTIIITLLLFLFLLFYLTFVVLLFWIISLCAFLVLVFMLGYLRFPSLKALKYVITATKWSPEVGWNIPIKENLLNKILNKFINKLYGTKTYRSAMSEWVN